jgi:hypothetical protein
LPEWMIEKPPKPTYSAPLNQTPHSNLAHKAAASAEADAGSEGGAPAVVSAATPGSAGRKKASRLVKLGGTPQAKRNSAAAAAEQARKLAQAEAAAIKTQAAARRKAAAADCLYAPPEDEDAQPKPRKGKQAAAHSAGEQQQ